MADQTTPAPNPEGATTAAPEESSPPPPPAEEGVTTLSEDVETPEIPETPPTKPAEELVEDPETPPASLDLDLNTPADGSAPPADGPPEELQESLASPELDVPEVVNEGDEGVELGQFNIETGEQTFLLDLDGDGVAETEATGLPLGDGTFKVVDARPIDEPAPDAGGPVDDLRGAPKDEVPSDKADSEVEVVPDPDSEVEVVPDPDSEVGVVPDPDSDVEVVPEPVNEATPEDAVATPPKDEVPGEAPLDGAQGAQVNVVGADDAVEVPAGLFEAPPTFAAGAAEHQQVAVAPAGGGAVDGPADAAAEGGYDPTAPDYEVEGVGLPTDDEPLSVLTQEDEGDDPGLLERIADTVRDVFDRE